jgi:hypothetical protein
MSQDFWEEDEDATLSLCCGAPLVKTWVGDPRVTQGLNYEFCCGKCGGPGDEPNEGEEEDESN